MWCPMEAADYLEVRWLTESEGVKTQRFPCDKLDQAEKFFHEINNYATLPVLLSVETTKLLG